MKKVSVIIPIYNLQNYIERCLDSVLKQTYSNMEIILVNDGSTDRSLTICEEYAKRDSRIRVFSKQNGGASSARNVGLSYVKGDLLTFVDGDDVLHQDYLKILYLLLIDTNSDIVSANDIRIFNEEEINPAFINDIDIKGKKIYSNTEAILMLYKGHIPCSVYSKLYKVSLFKNIRFDENLSMFEDNYILSKLFYGSKKLSHIDIDLYFYIQRDGSLTKPNTYNTIVSNCESLCVYIEKEIFFIMKNKLDYLINEFSILSMWHSIKLLTEVEKYDVCIKKHLEMKIAVIYKSMNKNILTLGIYMRLKIFLYRYKPLRFILKKIKKSW